MSFFDILHLALRNLRQAKLRAVLTTMGVIVGVAVIVTITATPTMTPIVVRMARSFA